MPRNGANRIAVVNENVPNMLGQISTCIAEAGLIFSICSTIRGMNWPIHWSMSLRCSARMLEHLADIKGMLNVAPAVVSTARPSEIINAWHCVEWMDVPEYLLHRQHAARVAAIDAADENECREETSQTANRIDALDEQIQTLINARARVRPRLPRSDGAGLKKTISYRPEREAAILRRVSERNTGHLAGRRKWSACSAKSCRPAWPWKNH